MLVLSRRLRASSAVCNKPAINIQCLHHDSSFHILTFSSQATYKNLGTLSDRLSDQSVLHEELDFAALKFDGKKRTHKDMAQRKSQSHLLQKTRQISPRQKISYRQLGQSRKK